MRLAKAIVLTSALINLFATLAAAGTIISEHVTGGYLDLPWTYGFATPNTMYGKTLDPSDPAYANPSGDHTVAVAQNASPDSGGICVTVTDPGTIGPDYAWEGWFFTGDGSTRRGLIVRATPANNFESFYQQNRPQAGFRRADVGAAQGRKAASETGFLERDCTWY